MKNQFFSRLEWDTSQLLRKSLTSLRALTLLLVMCLSIGNVWGASPASKTGSSFTAVSGDLDNNISYTSDKAGGTTAPVINSGNIRLYRNNSSSAVLGSTLTITPKNSATITKVEVSLKSSLGYSYSVDGGSATTGTGASITINCSATSSVVFQNYSKSQMDVTGITVTYTGGAGEKTLVSVTVSGDATNKDYEVGDAFDPTGLVVTAHYESDPDETITEGITWSYNPSQILVKDQTSIGVKATVSEITSVDWYNVTGLTVAEPAPKTYANTYTSNVTLSTTGGTSASSAKIKVPNDATEYDGIKCGTSSVFGAMKLTVPAGTTTLHTHLAGWGSGVVITITGATVSPTSVNLTADAGMSGNSPYTLQLDPSTNHYYVFNLSGITSDTELTFTASGNKRFAIFGVNAVASTEPSITLDPQSHHFIALDNAKDSAEFDVETANLTGSLSAYIIDDNDSKFSATLINENSKAKVIFNPGAVGDFSAKLVVRSVDDNVSDTASLTGRGNSSSIAVTGVTLDQHALALEAGAHATLNATITPDDASVKTLTWTSDNTVVATVVDGVVTAVSAGSANITATSNNNISDVCAVTVTTPAKWTKVTTAKDNWAGEYLLVFENSNKAYVWTGVDAANCNQVSAIVNGEIDKKDSMAILTIAQITDGYSIKVSSGICGEGQNNKFIGGKSGSNTVEYSDDAILNTIALSGTNAVITSNTSTILYNNSNSDKRFRYYKSGSSQQSVQLYERVSTEPSIKLNKNALTLSAGAFEDLTATIKNSTATAVWTTSNDKKATVTSSGRVTAVAEGSATIYATITEAAVDYVDSCVVTVTPAATVTSVTISPAEGATLYIYGTTPTKQSQTFTAAVVGENDPSQAVTWTSMNSEVASVSAEGLVAAVAAGETKIIATSNVDASKADTVDVIVKVFENTAATAYTTAEAIELIDALGDKIANISVYVKGVVSQNDGLNNNAITYWLDENAFEVYKGKNINGTNFTSADQIKVGDHVVVYGKLTKYTGSSTIYEFASGSALVSRKTAAVLAWSAGTYTAELGLSSYDYPTLTKTPSNIENVLYESSNTAAATIDPATGEIALVAEGNTTIKASFAGNDSLLAAVDATYELYVKAEVVRYTITYNSNGGSEIAPVADQTNLPATFPTPTKDFKVFGGWYFDNNVFEVAAVANMPLTKDTTLYAKWDEPKSITEMIALIPTSGDEVDNVYGWGYIKAGATVSSGNANYYITDGSDNDFYIYKGLNVNGESFTSADQLPSGNKVMIYGNIKNFKGTPEFDQGSRIINNAAVEVPVTGVSLNKAAAEVMVGKNMTLVATVAPSHATNQNVSWSSNKESIATVDATGKVTGVAAGDATITVTTEDGGFQASCAVTVVAAPTFDNGIWVKVTNTADLTADSYVIIAAKSYAKAIKTYVSGNNHGAQDVTVSGEILSYTTAPAIFQVKDYVKESATVGKAFLNIESGNYLYLPDNNNKLTETASMEDKSAFTFAITDGVHALTNYSLTGRQMKYNNGSTCFACYASGQDNIVVYKYMEGAFALSFDANGGQKTSVPGSMIVQGAVTIPSDVPTHATAGTKFAYYTPDKAGEGTHYVPGQENCEFTQNTTLYAQWNVLTARHITYNAGGGTGSVPTDAVNYYEGNVVTLKAATNLSNPGHIFASWEVSYNNGEKQIVEVVDDQFEMPDYDVTATAQWAAKSNDKWVLVTSKDDLVAGDKYVFASNAKGAVNGNLSGAYLTKVNATFSDNKAYITGMANQLPLELGSGSKDNTWTFRKDASNYLANASASLSWSETATEWTISFSEQNVLIVADNETIKFNATANPQRFKTYGTSFSGSDVQLYRMIPAVVVEETVDASTLDDYANITVNEGGNLTLTSGTKNLGDVYVMAGGKITLEESVSLTVANFVIKSTMAGGQSGQVIGVTASNLVISGDAYYDVTLDGNADPTKWHAVGVPFDVDAINGIYDMDDNKLVNETNYSVMVYRGDVRAEGKYGWDKIHRTNDKIMHPGVFYLFGVDGTKGTTYRFKMNGGFSVQETSISVTKYTGAGAATDFGWNGIGNNQLEYSAIDKDVQVLNISTYTFEAKIASSTNFTVGTPFFYQADATGSVELLAAINDKPAYAPARMGNEAKDIDVTLANEKYTDHLYLSATDEATNEYQIGRDLTKMTMTSTPVVPQIFGQAYGVKLCMVDAPMVNDQASYSVLLYAPAAGEYTMDAAQVEGYEVFLTKNGEVIWNLSMSAATVDLAKGNNTGYGIVIKKAPQVTTDMDNIYNRNDEVQKFIFNDNLYIIRGGKMFNAEGKLMK